ncbi:MAG: DUF4249 domain-containing protein [Crocinitomicaceae bacterium]|jgi:hypothetical protein|nr:DUF4249 domain-containing protein [Crocinitomicaceae bacterium]
MKSIIRLSIFFILLGIISSCTKVIEVDINDKDPQYVIEGFVTLGETTHRVSITKSQNLSASSVMPTVDNAIVVLSDDLGNSQTMVLVSPGIYEATAYPVAEGRTYSLSVNIASEVFVASGKMMQNVVIDTLETFAFSFGPTSLNALVPVRQDPGGIDNYYKFNIIANNILKPGIFIQEDAYNDGNLMMEPIFADGIESGDTVDVEMFGIDESVFKYFYTLQQNEQGATPANPTSNFSGGCLGYFSVRTKSVKQIVIP